MATIPSKAPFKTLTLDHDVLGPLKGRLIDETHFDGTKVIEPVVHFRSIPYATIPARFKQSRLLSSIPDDFDDRPKGDFTEYGYACPQVPQSLNAKGGFLPGEQPVQYNELACTNLTISAPVKAFPSQGSAPQKLLPVMVYIHGGGFVEGAGHVRASYETCKMADLASAEKNGVVIVSIGYRVNWQGFLTCQDLIDEAAELGAEEREAVFNYGLRDQRNAFRWIKNNISGFGGDPENLTAFGESGGAVSLTMHLSSDIPLFNRVIIQSGHTALQGRETLEDHEAAYDKLLTFLGISGATGRERLAALREVPVSRLVDAIREMNIRVIQPHSGPEAEFFPVEPTYSNFADIIAKNEWIGDIFWGDDFFEGIMWQSALRFVDQRKLLATFQKALGDAPAKRVLEAYDLYSDDMALDPNLSCRNMILLIGDLMFSEPTDTAFEILANSKERGSRKLYRYNFNLPNPFPGSEFSYVHGHHFVELLYQFMTLTTRLPKFRNGFLERQSIETARAWIRFANGRAPFDGLEYEVDTCKIAVCDDLVGWQVRTRKEDEEISQSDPWGPRRYRQWKIIREALLEAAARHDSGAGDAAGKARSQCLAFEDYLLLPKEL